VYAKTTEPIKMPFEGPENHVLDGVVHSFFASSGGVQPTLDLSAETM